MSDEWRMQTGWSAVLSLSGVRRGDKITVVRVSKGSAPDGSEDYLYYKSKDGSEQFVTRHQTKANGDSHYPCAQSSKRARAAARTATAATLGELENALYMPPGDNAHGVKKAAKRAKKGKS